MRVAPLSFLLYSISLVAVVSGQSSAVTDVTSVVSTPTTSEQSTTSEATTISEPTTTSETPTTTSVPTTTSESTTSEPTTAPSTTSTTSRGTTTQAPTTSSSETEKPTVKTITTIHTISGTPVQTTMLSSATDSAATESPSLNGKADDSGSSGLSDSEKKIVIGVVVGVGGAILIGAIAVVAWRMHVRKRNALDQDDSADLMSGTAVGAGVREKAPSPAQGTPFRSTLDQYHNPGPVNAASNF
ncbi:hypothetical protein BDV59DRAFT_169572 [Aspergillus ambiguus]|uniref:putative cell wall protein n=1 Tax=Aspergillus ambiguus TaxID=176160 RepID=UPI003CCD2AC1